MVTALLLLRTTSFTCYTQKKEVKIIFLFFCIGQTTGCVLVTTDGTAYNGASVTGGEAIYICTWLICGGRSECLQCSSWLLPSYSAPQHAAKLLAHTCPVCHLSQLTLCWLQDCACRWGPFTSTGLSSLSYWEGDSCILTLPLFR